MLAIDHIESEPPVDDCGRFFCYGLLLVASATFRYDAVTFRCERGMFRYDANTFRCTGYVSIRHSYVSLRARYVLIRRNYVSLHRLGFDTTQLCFVALNPCRFMLILYSAAQLHTLKSLPGSSDSSFQANPSNYKTQHQSFRRHPLVAHHREYHR